MTYMYYVLMEVLVKHNINSFMYVNVRSIIQRVSKNSVVADLDFKDKLFRCIKSYEKENIKTDTQNQEAYKCCLGLQLKQGSGEGVYSKELGCGELMLIGGERETEERSQCEWVIEICVK